MTDTVLLKRVRRLERELAYIKTLERVVPETMFSGAILSMPVLRGFWPMSSVDYASANRGVDVSGQGNHLTANNTPTFGVSNSRIPLVDLDAATSHYLSRADGGASNWADILGTEGYVRGANRGLTMGGWFYFSSNTALTFTGMMSKWNANTNDRSYLLSVDWANSRITAFLSNNGAATAVSLSYTGISAAQWYFVVMRYDPSTSLELFVNGDTATTTVGVPASLYNGAADFEIGRYTAAGPTFRYLDALVSMCFLSASDISSRYVEMIYELSRDTYGV